MRERDAGLELLAYDFEIRFPAGRYMPFLRFDLNLPGHANADRDLRCHLHPGTEDFLVPAPLLAPDELLDLFIDHIQLPEGRDPRTPTRFEATWYAHAALRAKP